MKCSVGLNLRKERNVPIFLLSAAEVLNNAILFTLEFEEIIWYVQFLIFFFLLIFRYILLLLLFCVLFYDFPKERLTVT